ncbi:hypothetical protein COD05_26325 [Bacillus cereus]|uniref:Uncharacterized protein n=1 Tax=Bacillus wiedmannii TaxID=1890302 RepID=A0AB73R3T4_9BACI|nr:hypothetical protein CN694_28740 [Bacillus wiedmannii]PEW51775.1 hypothetical protein CN431_03190 [Bacillus cereus]PFW75938.1 hypothetical protein COL27_27435 [Bacillus sp. AFS075960]PFF89803.1 hypothetical protein CN338_02495 [Bacillus cereus]PFI50043.1 hypothetical protein COI76_22180 [Bacillus cereus]
MYKAIAVLAITIMAFFIFIYPFFIVRLILG